MINFIELKHIGKQTKIEILNNKLQIFPIMFSVFA